MHEHSYGKAAELARRLLTLNRQDNGSWDRLVQAQFGLRDYDDIKRTLDEWRRTVSKPSPKLDEYAGDLALTEYNPTGAVEAWTKVLECRTQNTSRPRKSCTSAEESKTLDRGRRGLDHLH